MDTEVEEEEDEELEEFVRETFLYEETDMNYEFDAARFFDFDRTETDWEAREAERWFESARGYPPSPFIIRLHWNKDKGVPMGVLTTSSKSTVVNSNNRGAKAKSTVKSTITRCSTLMKPTASHLAKQRQLVHSIPSMRLQTKLGIIDEESSQNSSVAEEKATKRQKLEGGFLSKAAQLKHKALLLHKKPKNSSQHDDRLASSVNAKLRATIPREPDLETAHRAERRRNKMNAESTKSNAHTFKARPLNRKILESPLTLHRRTEPQLPEFQVFRLKTLERAMENTFNNNHTNIPWNSSNTEGKRSNCVDRLRQEKRETVDNSQDSSPTKKKLASDGKLCIFRNIKQRSNFSTDKRFQDEPPIHLFSKLRLTSEDQINTRPSSESTMPIKGTIEKTPYCLYKENEMSNLVKERPQRLGGIDFVDCGRNRRIHEFQQNINRSLDIC
ncbi:protein TPX2 isoform X1 [Cannabis sativa]|uniref:protein TPX2 isoform X1 n=1 Tax=Cannabis sativa TaxID=3483 RepID=UPI0029CA7859|nr:protein TPX2 isoform X1 [Cannabis sativa]